MAVTLKMTVFWNVMAYSLVVYYYCLEGACCIYVQKLKIETVSSTKMLITFLARMCGVTSQETVIFNCYSLS
jgi:hypothetical protein